MQAARRAPRGIAWFDDVADPNEVPKALSTLELEGLLEREFAGYRITERGALVGAVLQSRAGA